MFFIDTSRNGKPVYNAIVNQSLDNYLVNDLRLPGHGLILYVNNPSVIIGVHQNAYAEVNFPYLKEKNIQLVRRTSGGGAVYHDYGNFIFENIVIGNDEHFGEYDYFAKPILDALHAMGATDAQMHGRNDIVIDGKKFSGMTMFKVGDSFAAGGTLMFDLDMDTASKVLTPEKDKLESKGVKSVNKRITNIKSYLDEPYRSMDPVQFKDELLKHIFKVDKLSDIKTYKLTDHDWDIIDSRLKDKYDTDAWNYGKNPGFTNYVSKHFDIGTVAFNFSLKDEKISAIKIYGDFITGGDVSLIEKALLGTKFEKSALVEALSKVDLKNNLGDIEPEPLIDLLLS
ncbi:lipoate--protein ligase [Companilactobacillus pabuli]|jgi:lipoate-protein ligase A|uniref:lipoate--protein ligase n=1 Tax=Companilactobacillus pabuli TaxID=2714036 RepID=A0A7L7KZA3_9LACO|nr:lipoate--protein ligase [Companilactobacillus pabuli]AKP02935.1 lipoate--protein ligase [Companilactobacillus farciminis]AKS51235.1 lipoate--protein ligase [Companilactobacillus farciminis]MDG5112007.1 lipoate--protein ligase [Companilactobacillus pabuli]QMT85123.1 lipoate--protein ligase [Companilactobacillus pabuli]